MIAASVWLARVQTPKQKNLLNFAARSQKRLTNDAECMLSSYLGKRVCSTARQNEVAQRRRVASGRCSAVATCVLT